MNTISRRTLGGLGLAAAAATTAACGRSEPSSDEKASADPIGKGKATGKLTVWAMGAEGEKLPQLVKGFEKENPDVEVTVTPIPWDSAHDKFTSAIAAGTAPDVAQVGSTWMAEFVDLKALEPTPDEVDTSVFFSGAEKAAQVGGTTYGVPWYVETRVVFYRTDLAKKAGFTEPPTDWEGLLALAKAMQKKAGAKWGLALQPGGTGSWQSVLPFIWSNGGKVANDDDTKFTFEGTPNTEAVAYYQSYFTDKVADKSPAEGTTEQDFVSGAAPMFISGPWMMSAVEAAGGKGFADKYGVFVLPTKETSTSFLGGANLGVFQGSKNRDSAWKLVQYLSTPTAQVEWFGISTDLPAVESAWDDDKVAKNAKFEVFHQQLDSAQAPPAIATWEQVASRFDSQLEKVCKEGLDPAKALATTQSEAEGIGTGA